MLKSRFESNDKDVIIVIDNTPLPSGGAQALDNIVLEYSITSGFLMTYNLRNVSIYMGITTMVLCFAIGALSYLTYKVKLDINRKFLSDEDDDEEEETDSV